MSRQKSVAELATATVGLMVVTLMVTIDMTIERMDAERLFSYRWHPHAVDASHDYSQEPTTLVEFTLEDVPEGTRLTIVESGFDRIPGERRATAFAREHEPTAIIDP